MKISSNIQCLQNTICLGIGLLILFSTSIFVIKNFYQNSINSLIESATVLKDINYNSWGMFPGNNKAIFTHSINFYNYTSNNKSEALPPVILDYSYQYNKIIFGQGNQGSLKYLHNWQRKISSNQPKNITQMVVNSVNVVPQTIFNYQYLATKARTLSIGFNLIRDSVKQMLPRFYATYLYLFYLHDQDVVSKVIFDQIHLSEQIQKNLFEDSKYGWSQAQTLINWFKLVHLSTEQRLQHPFYEDILYIFGLSSIQMENLVGPKSILHKLSSALNGTIKYKVQSSTFKFMNCKQFCSDDQLVSIQLANGLLTNTPLMGNINLKKMAHQFNQSIPYFIEYSSFCKSQDDFTCLDDKNIYFLFQKNIFGNFALVKKILQNKDNLDIIQNIFGYQDPMGDNNYGKSFIAYMEYLTSQVFVYYDEETQQSFPDSYKYMFPNHLYLIKQTQNLKIILKNQLYAKAMINVIQQNKYKCQDFQYNNIKICNNNQTNPTQIQGIRNYIKAYNFINRQQMINKTNMNWSQMSNFLKIDQKNSLFAKLINNIQKNISKIFKCNYLYCSAQQLMIRQWSGSNPVLSNLPKQYFTSNLTLNQLDIDNLLNSGQPRYFNIFKEQIPLDQAQQMLGNGPNSILILYNMMKLYYQSTKRDEKSSKIIKYIQQSVLDCSFGGYLQKRTVQQYIFGFQHQAINLKRNYNSQLGGTPWLSNKLSSIQTSHQSDQFNKINTGIYDDKNIRNIIQVSQNKAVTSKYTVFKDQDNDVKEILTSPKKVKGTNMLGFHHGLTSEQNIYGFLDVINTPITLTPIDSSSNFFSLSPVIKYKISESNQIIKVDIQEQKNRYVIISPESYIKVQPNTGITVQISIKFSLYTSLDYFDLLGDQKINKNYKIYDMLVTYQRSDIDDLLQINKQKNELNILFIVAIVLAALSILLIIIMTILYCKKKGVKRDNRLIDTLISGQTSMVI